MKCTSEMGSVVMIYIPSLIKIGSGIHKLMGEGDNSMVISYAYLYVLKLRKVG
jgi:hypothetical protein